MRKKYFGCPAWLKMSEDRTSFILLSDRADIVRRIFDASISGLGGFTIAKQLNAKNVPAFGPSPKWEQSTVNNMLRNRATIGEYQPKRLRNGKRAPEGDPIPDVYPAAIDEELFNAAQEARRKNLTSGRGRKGQFVTNLFSGMLKCAYCANQVKLHNNGDANSLICSRVIEKLGCHRTAWSYPDFEKSFFQFVKKNEWDLLLNPNTRGAITSLLGYIQSLADPHPNIYDARMGIAITLKSVIIELRIAAAGSEPNKCEARTAESRISSPSAKVARIKRDRPGRYFEVAFRDSPIRIGFAAE